MTVRAPWRILGVSEDAGREQVVAAYRRLAMRWHPDRTSERGAQARFQEVQRAYRAMTGENAPEFWRKKMDDMLRRSGVSEGGDTVDGGDGLGGHWRELPAAAMFFVFAGVVSFVLAPPPLGLIALSAAMLLACANYHSGKSARARTAERWFKTGAKGYFIAFCAWMLWRVARALQEGL